jgi:DNA polymerase III delta prime subunit
MPMPYAHLCVYMCVFKCTAYEALGHSLIFSFFSCLISHTYVLCLHACVCVRSGALLVGPPGTGKTLLAKAAAGEVRCAVSVDRT